MKIFSLTLVFDCFPVKNLKKKKIAFFLPTSDKYTIKMIQGYNYAHIFTFLAGFNYTLQFKGKLINQTWKNGKNLVSGPILAPLAQIWTQNFFSMDFTSTWC